MVQNVVSIDGKYYNLTIPEGGITRSFSVLDTDKSGRLQSGEMFRDVIGTYYNYKVKFSPKNMSPKEYDDFYEVISSPVDKHVITVPYGQSILTFDAYVTSGEDVLKKVENGTKKWGGITISFVAMSPKRRPI